LTNTAPGGANFTEAVEEFQRGNYGSAAARGTLAMSEAALVAFAPAAGRAQQAAASSRAALQHPGSLPQQATQQSSLASTPVQITPRGGGLTQNSAPQIRAGTTQSDAITNLRSQGYVERSIAKPNGSTITVLSKDGKSYTFYSSTGGGNSNAPSGLPRGDVQLNGQTTSKITFDSF